MNSLHYTPAAKLQRDAIIGNDKEREQAFQYTEQGLRERNLAPGDYTKPVAFTNYRLEIEVDRDKMLRITTVEITGISGGAK